MNIWTILLALSLLNLGLAQQACSVDEDCKDGFECREFVECNDFGCSTPNYQCWPSQDQPTSLTSGTGSGGQMRTQTSSQRKAQPENRVQQDDSQAPGETPAHQASSAASAAAAAESVPSGPSRLIIRTRNNDDSILRFDSTNNDFSYSFRMNPSERRFDLRHGPTSILRFNEDGSEIQCGEDVMLRTDALEVQGLWRFSDSQLYYNGVPQWKLVHDELFRVGQLAEGWSLPDSVTQCGAVHMLGGYCATSNENLVKVFDNLPSHTRIKIEANFHFLDSWGGETAFLRVSENEELGTLNYAWTDSYDYVSARNAVNVCGRDIGDGKFNSFISFEMLHSFNQIRVMFGTSLEQKACAASYGISSFRIYVL